MASFQARRSEYISKAAEVNFSQFRWTAFGSRSEAPPQLV